MTVRTNEVQVEAHRAMEARHGSGWTSATAAAEQVPFIDQTSDVEPLAVGDEPAVIVGQPIDDGQDEFAFTMEASEEAIVILPAEHAPQIDEPSSGTASSTSMEPPSIGDDMSVSPSFTGALRGTDLLTEEDTPVQHEPHGFPQFAGSLPVGTGIGAASTPFENHGDLMFLDFDSYAKGGNGGGKNKPSDGGDSGSGGSDPAVLADYTSGMNGGYNVEIEFKGSWTPELQQAFIDAADWLSSIIEDDVADVFFRGKIIDDIRISAELTNIDGAGGILGQAGPTAIRTANYLPATAIMEFDIADADAFNAMGLWDDIVLHEMLHSIGFGSIWNYTGDIAGAATADPLFTGEGATLAYNEMFETVDGALGVPVEEDGGPGTRDSHWDEQTFNDEIMTGYINGSNYVSPMTVASLEDIGYGTVWDSTRPLDIGTDPLIA